MTSPTFKKKLIFDTKFKYQPDMILSYSYSFSNKKKLYALLLCLLSLVGLNGLHRLYVGKIKSGIFYFLTFGLLFVGTSFDLFNLIRGKFKDKFSLPLTH